jgi:hypothetical protein
MVIWRSQVADRIVGFAAGEAKVDVMTAAFDTNVLKQVATEIENVKAEYGGVVSEESIDLVAGESLQKLAGSRVPQFVPLFVGRFTRERLQELTGLRPHARFSLLARLGASDSRPPSASTGTAFVPTT